MNPSTSRGGCLAPVERDYYFLHSKLPIFAIIPAKSFHNPELDLFADFWPFCVAEGNYGIIGAGGNTKTMGIHEPGRNHFLFFTSSCSISWCNLRWQLPHTNIRDGLLSITLLNSSCFFNIHFDKESFLSNFISGLGWCRISDLLNIPHTTQTLPNFSANHLLFISIWYGCLFFNGLVILITFWKNTNMVPDGK